MSVGLIIRSVFEFALIVLAVVAMINEPKIADFERKFARACVIHYRNRQRRKALNAPAVQSRAPEAPQEEFEAPKLTLIDCTSRVA